MEGSLDRTTRRVGALREPRLHLPDPRAHLLPPVRSRGGRPTRPLRLWPRGLRVTPMAPGPRPGAGGGRPLPPGSRSLPSRSPRGSRPAGLTDGTESAPARGRLPAGHAV